MGLYLYFGRTFLWKLASSKKKFPHRDLWRDRSLFDSDDLALDFFSPEEGLEKKAA
jgi:hypothetical protein